MLPLLRKSIAVLKVKSDREIKGKIILGNLIILMSIILEGGGGEEKWVEMVDNCV
jgi:hypothetical protein